MIPAMGASCRFAFAVHVLTMLASNPGRGLTSEEIARSVNTNPVVIRRLLSSLSRAGLIATRHGAGAGSRLSRAPEAIRLDAVYVAVEPSPAFSFHPHLPNRRCPVGRKIEKVLEGVFVSAQRALEEALARRTMADVLGTMTRGESPKRIRTPRRRQRKAA
jgi:Rrf2 family protein